jgi:hypothetical protein
MSRYLDDTEICDAAYKKEFEAAARNEPWSKKVFPLSYIDRLVAMFAPNVIGYSDKKLGILRSIAGGRADSGGNDNGRRGRINTLLVGARNCEEPSLREKQRSYFLIQGMSLLRTLPVKVGWPSSIR